MAPGSARAVPGPNEALDLPGPVISGLVTRHIREGSRCDGTRSMHQRRLGLVAWSLLVTVDPPAASTLLPSPDVLIAIDSPVHSSSHSWVRWLNCVE